jgi:hypothetical protein
MTACAAQAVQDESPLVKQKIEALEQLAKDRKDHGAQGTYKNPVARPVTLRDSGHRETLLFLENTNFRFDGNVGFYVPRLFVSLVPNDPAQPVVFDDPTSFSIRPHKGEAVLSNLVLDTVFNDIVFNFKEATVRKIKVTAGQGDLKLEGELYRRKWIPFVMNGKLSLEGGTILWYKLAKVTVNDVDATQVLPAANVELDELITIDAKGVKLIGSSLRIDTTLLFPPPKLHIDIKAIRTEPRGLVLVFDDGNDVPAPPAQFASKSHMLVMGGDVKFMRTMPVNVSLQIMSDEPGKELDFNLYRYREQVAKGYLKLGPGGEIFGYLANHGKLAPKGGKS